ncbi:MAG: glycerol-3-phosphate 1-O-acyltransferase PlsY [Clostridia bacterium]|nr:glycerol-3-phosphate 1-O-acyltransferase PlsY [Clostridia bacterium]
MIGFLSAHTLFELLTQSLHLQELLATALCTLLCILLPYLLGSVNFALVISKIFYKDDIRKYGSGNAGMTNMLRTYGKGAALFTLLCDMLKAVISVWFGIFVFGILGGYIAGLFCIIGHSFPIYFKFKGGKGVATTAAMILTLDPICFCALFILFILIVLITRYVSLGSIMGMLLYPVLTYRLATWGKGFPVLISFLVAVFVIFMHRENIKRLLHHSENKISFSKKKDKQ